MQFSAKFACDFELADLVSEDLLIPQLAANSKIGAIKDLVDRLHDKGFPGMPNETSDIKSPKTKKQPKGTGEMVDEEGSSDQE